MHLDNRRQETLPVNRHVARFKHWLHCCSLCRQCSAPYPLSGQREGLEAVHRPAAARHQGRRGCSDSAPLAPPAYCADHACRRAAAQQARPVEPGVGTAN